jgi:hypothetical protein
MPAPIGIEADLRLDLRSDVGTRVEARVQNIVGYIRADFRLRKQQEAPNSEADRHEGIEIVRLRQERAVDLARLGHGPRRRSKPQLLHLYPDFFRLGRFARLVAEPAKSRRGGLRRRLVARAAEASGRILSCHRLRIVGCLVLSGP